MDIIIFIGGLFQNIMGPLIDLFREKEVAPFLALIVLIGAIIIFVIASYIWFFKQKPHLKNFGLFKGECFFCSIFFLP